MGASRLLFVELRVAFYVSKPKRFEFPPPLFVRRAAARAARIFLLFPATPLTPAVFQIIYDISLLGSSAIGVGLATLYFTHSPEMNDT